MASLDMASAPRHVKWVLSCLPSGYIAHRRPLPGSRSQGERISPVRKTYSLSLQAPPRMARTSFSPWMAL